MEIPKLVGRYYKPFNLFGWIMSLIGLFLMCKFAGLGSIIERLSPIFGITQNWWLLLLTFYVTLGYMLQVALGRVYMYVYYDTIIRTVYEIKTNFNGEIFRVAADSEEELNMYMNIHYPNIEFTINDEYDIESFLKKEKYV
jgi:hypothetical protein